jgi:hypothetical protein
MSPPVPYYRSIIQVLRSVAIHFSYFRSSHLVPAITGIDRTFGFPSSAHGLRLIIIRCRVPVISTHGEGFVAKTTTDISHPSIRQTAQPFFFSPAVAFFLALDSHSTIHTSLPQLTCSLSLTCTSTSTFVIASTKEAPTTREQPVGLESNPPASIQGTPFWKDDAWSTVSSSCRH